jgi:predicted PurR-regulated permease PerM
MKRAFPWGAALTAAAVVAFSVHFLMPVLIPFALACTAAYVLNPLANACEVRGLRRQAVVVTAYIVALAALVLLAGRLVPLLGREFASLQDAAPAYAGRLKLSLLEMQRRLIEQAPFAAEQIRHLDANKALGRALELTQNLPSYLLSFFPLLSFLFLIPFISFFLLLDGSSSIDRMIQRCPSRYVEQALHLVSEIDHSLGAYLRGLVLVAVVLTIASYLGLIALGVNQAFWIAVLSGVSSFVPYLGAIVGMIAGGLAAAFQFGSAVAGLKVVLLFLLIRLADEILLQPYIAKHSVHLHPLVFLFTFMTGGELFGFIGLLFAVPVACVIKALINVGWSWYSTEARLAVDDAADVSVVPFT